MSGWPCPDPTTSSRNSPTPSTACSRGWRHPSTPSGGSPPAPRTSCARPRPGNAPCSRSPSPTRLPPPAPGRAVSRELLASNAGQEHLIEALLILASSEAGPAQREPADLAAITSAALAAARPAVSRLGLHVQADIQPAALDGDPLLVQQLAANLIDNAARHNIPGGDVRITTSTSHAGAVLSVTNSGQVIPPAEVDRLFQPFQRLGPRPARRDGGHGLGLSIVRAIATAHAATITARPRPGGGLAIDVTFHPSTSSPVWRTSRGRAITAS
jgi:signal transduction histidine kinase